MRLWPGHNSLRDLAILRIHDQKSAVRSLVPPTGGHVQFVSIHRNAGSVAAHFIVLLLPKHFLGFQIEPAQPPRSARIIDRVVLHTPAKAAQPFLEWYINSSHQFVT